MEEKDYKRSVENKSKLPENSTCIDCNAPGPKWASVRYGTFFCLECAAIHRSLGVFLDFVQSVNLNTWSKEAYMPIKYGGNAKFREYLKTHHLEHLETEARYNNNLCIEYTKELADIIQKATGIELKPSVKKDYSKKKTPVKEDNRFESPPKEFVKKPLHRDSYSDLRSVKSETIPRDDSTVRYTDKLGSSLTNLSSFISSSVKVISDKTKKYGSAIGSSVKSFYEKGSEKILTRNSEPESAKQNPVNEFKPKKYENKASKKEQDWS